MSKIKCDSAGTAPGKIPFYMSIMASLCWSAVALADELPMDRFDYLKKSYDELEVDVPKLPEVEERGIMVKCDNMMIPAIRLELWAKSLIPKSEREREIAWKKVYNKKEAVRYVSLRSLAFGVGLDRTDLGNQHSFFDALLSVDSDQFKALVSLLKAKCEESKSQAQPDK